MEIKNKKVGPGKSGKEGERGWSGGGIHAREGTTVRQLYGTATSATGRTREVKRGGAGRDDFILASDRAGQREWDILDAKKQEMGAGRDDFIHASDRARQREGAIVNAAK